MIHYDPRWGGPHGIGRFSDEVIARLPDARALRIGATRLSLLDPIATTLAAARLETGVYFTPGFNPPLRAPVPVVFCLYDLIYLRVPSESTLARRAYFSLVVRPAARRAFRVLTISAHSRAEILEWSGLDAERVVDVGCGVGSVFRSDGPRHEAGYPYFLFVGLRGPHKNVARLVEAYAASKSRANVRLLFTGEPDRATQEAARRHGVEREVVFAGRLDDAQLATCYRGALALAHPSLYEGFGLPVAEAMACGTPVLTTNGTALAETAGAGNALFVDPLSVEAIAAGLDRMADDSALREDLKRRGLARATHFSWDRVGAAVAKVLAEAGV